MHKPASRSAILHLSDTGFASLKYTLRNKALEFTAFLKLSKLDNVDVTFSKHENHSSTAVKKVLASGVNVAVVFNGKVPSTYIDIKVIDGDKHDRRFEDDKGRIIGLKLKGTNKVKQLAIQSGFAV